MSTHDGWNRHPTKGGTQMAGIVHHRKLGLGPPHQDVDQQSGQDGQGYRRPHIPVPNRNAKCLVHAETNQGDYNTTADLQNRSLVKEDLYKGGGQSPTESHKERL